MSGSARRKQARYAKARRLTEKAEGQADSAPGGGRESLAEPEGPDRLFVALDLPAERREAIERWQARGLADPALRPVSTAGLHVTLCFLGHHPERALPRIGEIVRRVEPRAVELRFESEPVPLPGGRPRLYALGARSEAAIALQAELAKALGAEGFHEPEERPFWPHVTVARVRSERVAPGRGERRGKSRPKRVVEQPRGLPKGLTEPFEAVRVALYRSNLKPEGAEYEALEGVDLPSPLWGQKR